MTAPGGNTAARSTGSSPLVGFRRHLRPVVVVGEATYLFSEDGVTAVQGPEMEALAPLLDGTRDLETLLREAAPNVPPARLGALMGRLADEGLVALRPAGAPAAEESELAYWESAGLDGAIAAARTAAGRVHLAALGRTDRSEAEQALLTAGLTVTADPAEADLTVVLADDYLDPELTAVNADRLAAGRPWLLARPYGRQVWIGPVFRPGGACWSCLAHRLWGHRRAEAHVQHTLGEAGPAARPAAGLAALSALAAHLVALEAAKWLAGWRDPSQQAVWTLDTLTMAGRHHPLPARPQCRACGDPGLMAERQWRPVEFASRPKTGLDGGGHRALPPEQVLERYGHLISPVTGVVKEIRRDPRGPAFLNSFLAGSNLAVGAHSLGALRAGLRSSNGGKGVTELHGRVSALGEAVERHSGHFHGDEPRLRGSLRSLGERALDPSGWLLFDERQYADRAGWNARHNGFQHVPAPFDPDRVLDWSPVWSVTEGRHRLLPTAALYFGAPKEPGEAPCHADSNGNAAGSSLEDAVLQGFLELVERDAVALWWYNRTRQPGIDLDAFADPWTEQLREVHAELGREVWALDVTSDLGVPTVVALSRRTDKPAEDIVFGFGAHFDPRLALRRALTEVNQLLPAVLGARPDGTGYAGGDAEALRWWRHCTTGDQPHLVPDPAAAAIRPADHPYRPRRDLREDLHHVRRLVEERGMELLVLDQTRPDLGLPVVKVIVPGLRHFWARFAPGRLYDVPVRLGRLARPTPYERLNPIPIFI
ncbi:TOMM precursor leader peptide-binding protein [Kitasatospora sp. NPDC048365]|uniref:TOMM precursor leader peptide-binding protein n=1 Tax=Kitasatospora sp. NPDC048365 TaxID=3364050 RepID=UPI003715526A